MAIGNGLSGLRAATPYNLVLDAGVIYKNINVTMLQAGGIDAWANAIDPMNTWVDPNGTTVTPEHLGATRGGTTVKLNKDDKPVEFDSRRTNVKGMDRVNMINPQIETSLLEVGVDDIVEMALGAWETTDRTGFKEINPVLLVQDAHYIGNIALAATINGEHNPMIIVLSNARVVMTGDMSFKDHDEAVFQVTFQGHALASNPLEIPITYFIPVQYDGASYG